MAASGTSLFVFLTDDTYRLAAPRRATACVLRSACTSVTRSSVQAVSCGSHAETAGQLGLGRNARVFELRLPDRWVEDAGCNCTSAGAPLQ